jgi:serine/threonine protein kinase
MLHSIARHKCRSKRDQQFTAAGRKYKFRGLLGNGAVGVVRKAEDLGSGKVVAVKLLAPDPKYIDVKAFGDVEQRFKREGQRGAHLRDEHLVEIIAYEENLNGSSFLNPRDPQSIHCHGIRQGTNPGIADQENECFEGSERNLRQFANGLDSTTGCIRSQIFARIQGHSPGRKAS